ncbi:MAG TPA: TonB-dependent receptor [Povalibacter sp.]|nr:TonB-dependent receptor [Povalibacter sp.]
MRSAGSRTHSHVGVVAALGALFTTSAAHALQPATDALKKLSVEELMNVEVTSIARTPQKLSQAPSAIQVISAEEIHRAGATSLPEALRLAPNLQVAQANSSQWAISARGFNNILANKLLVMIDGRSVYTPLYGGVFWDVQDVVLDDVERIEVVSGPGATQWGANAVNGVINVVTRNSAQTQGLLAQAAAGSEIRSLGTLRYGGELNEDLHYRVYAKGFERGATVNVDSSAANDDWHMGQGGFRLDWQPGEDLLTLQADLYQGRPNPDGTTAVDASGGNLLGRWQRTTSSGADLQLQLYYDHTRRDFDQGLAESLDTWDIDWQHRFAIGSRQNLTWGLHLRRQNHEVDNLPLFAFLPAHKALTRYGLFVQDQIAVLPDRLELTLGTKIGYNNYTDYEYQPSARLAWTPDARNTLWAAVSRAVRTPSRIDRDFYLFLTPTIPLVTGSDFQSETLLAYELGWRVQPHEDLSLSLSSFYNDYDELRSAEPGPPPLGIPLTFGNGVQGSSYGLELAAVYQVSQRWRLRGGYTFLKKDLRLKPGSHDLNDASVESDDPRHQLLIQSMLDLPGDLRLDGVARYVDALPDPHVPAYVSLDLRLAWNPTEHLELSLVGQNLLDERHAEFVPASPAPRAIERSVYGQIAWRH